jgi:hypothetical protein
MRMVGGFQIAQAIHVAAVLGIADLLKDGPRSCEALAGQTETNAEGLYRLLRALASVEVFREGPNRTFSLSPLSECLRADSPESVRGWAVLIGAEYFWSAWGNLLRGVKTGENVFEQMHGMDVWEYRSTRPELIAIFNQAMTSNSRGVAQAVVGAYDFSPFKLIVDVGGNRGALLAAILTTHPDARGINFDQPDVVSDADLKDAGVADRCELVGGDFFESVPPGGDAYVLKSIIHDWPDDDSIAILKTVRQAMKPDARLLIVEQVVAPPNEGPSAKFSDLNMLALPGGRERTEEEFARLFEASGFRLTQVAAPGPDTYCIIEGVPL